MPFAKAPHPLVLRKGHGLPFIPLTAKHKKHPQCAVTQFDNLAKQRFLHLVVRKPRFVGLFYKVDYLSGFIQ
jgi:hypothetical protein